MDSLTGSWEAQQIKKHVRFILNLSGNYTPNEQWINNATHVERMKGNRQIEYILKSEYKEEYADQRENSIVHQQP